MTERELELILQSLRHTKEAYEKYEGAPSFGYKLEKVKEVSRLMDKIRQMLNEAKGEPNERPCTI
jgi:hypothetical protein